MRKLFNGIFLTTILFFFASTSCKRKELSGKEIFASSKFEIQTPFSISKSNPQFLTDNLKSGKPIFFNAYFNESVSWKITIVGNSSKAVKEISGTGVQIDVTNSVWQGESSSVVFFKANDTCTATLKISGVDAPVVLPSKIVIGNMLRYNYRVVNNVKYFVVDNFESQPTDLMGGGLAAPQGASVTLGFVGTSGDAADNGTPKFGVSSDYRVDGSKCYHMQGTDINKNGWLVSINHESLREMVGANLVNNLDSISAKDLYFNLYIRGTGKPNTTVELKAYELDTARSRAHLVKSVNDAKFSYNTAAQAKNDGWIYDIVVDWEGWKLISVPYDKFRACNDLLAGGNGNRVKEPYKITAMAMSLLSYVETGQDVSVDIDFVVLSQKGPFVPKY